MTVPEEFYWEGELRSRGQLETNEGTEFVSGFLACFSIRPVVVALTLLHIGNILIPSTRTNLGL